MKIWKFRKYTKNEFYLNNYIGKKKAPAPPPRTLPAPIALPRNATATASEQETTKSEGNLK